MSVFGFDPPWLRRLYPRQTAHWHTHLAHALAVLVVFAGNGYWVGAALPWLNGWQGYQLGGLVGLAFYLVREVEAHRYYRKRYTSGAITRAEYRLHLWDSRLDFLVPLAVTLPVIGHEYPIWQPLGLIWALVIVMYWQKPAGYAGGMKA
jgi:hypothetical protein